MTITTKEKMTETKKEIQEQLLYFQNLYEKIEEDISFHTGKIFTLSSRKIYLDKQITSLQLKE
jgi:hypothetical protein